MNDTATPGFTPLPFCSRCGGYHHSTTGGCPFPGEGVTVRSREELSIEVAALRAELQRVEGELASARQFMQEQADGQRHLASLNIEALTARQTAERERDWERERAERLATALTDLLASGVDDIDPRLDYINVQVDRDDWDAARAALGDGDERTEGGV